MTSQLFPRPLLSPNIKTRLSCGTIKKSPQQPQVKLKTDFNGKKQNLVFTSGSVCLDLEWSAASLFLTRVESPNNNVQGGSVWPDLSGQGRPLTRVQRSSNISTKTIFFSHGGNECLDSSGQTKQKNSPKSKQLRTGWQRSAWVRLVSGVPWIIIYPQVWFCVNSVSESLSCYAALAPCKRSFICCFFMSL